MDHPDDDIIQSFQLEQTSLRGRIIRFGPALNKILNAHDYPKPVSHLVAETATLSLLLSSMLKYEGIFTLQAQGDGPVAMVVADVTHGGHVRACASFSEERINAAREMLKALKTTESGQNNLAQLLGKGYLAFTVDKAHNVDRYQGIVERQGSSMIACVQHYFQQSEQIGTGLKIAVGQRDGQWRAGGIMLQHMPEEGRNPESGMGNLVEDDWRRTMILMDSCTEDELLDSDLHSNTLLMRLFHEEGVRVFTPQDIKAQCRCSREKVETILRMMPEDDVEYLRQEDKVVLTCEFCSTPYSFRNEDVAKLVKASSSSPEIGRKQNEDRE